MQEGYYEVDLSGNMMFCNDSLCGIIGYSRDELIGMNNRQYMPTEASKRVYETFLRVYNTGEATKAFDWEVITKDGSKKIVEASVTLIRDAKGAPVGFRGVVRDITDRKRAEEQAKLHQQQLMQAEQDGGPRGPGLGGGARDQQPQQLHHAERPHPARGLGERAADPRGVLPGERRFSDGRHEVLRAAASTCPSSWPGYPRGAERIKQIVANLKTYVRGDAGDLTQRGGCQRGHPVLASRSSPT
ncbi:MAG: PAS domain S-box protein [Candidatus Moduliflexus flocculans]|nr:PAS domain S-box protein [Candidatus Moduliflexus flocculans]